MQGNGLSQYQRHRQKGAVNVKDTRKNKQNEMMPINLSIDTLSNATKIKEKIMKFK